MTATSPAFIPVIVYAAECSCSFFPYAITNFFIKKIRQMKITVDEVLNKQHLDAAAKETHQSLKR